MPINRRTATFACVQTTPDTTLLAELKEFSGIAFALALGMLVGIQRGWAQRDHAAGTRFAGIRTYGLLGLAGGIAGALFVRAEGLSIVLLAGVAALVVIGYWRMSERDSEISGTGSLVGLLTLAAGFLAAGDEPLLASVATGTMVLVLSLRSQLHRFVGRLDEIEVLAIARFALIALVILPLLPDTPMGPLDAWRPRQLWLVVVLVSAFSFLGYAASRKFGATRGIIATSAAGATVSSTAVTASLSTKLQHDEEFPAILHAGIAAASMVMFLRVMVLTAALAGFALPYLARLAVPGLAVSTAATALFLWQARHERRSGEAGPTVRNPFDIGPALLLMGLVMVLSVVARWVLQRFGDAGLATVMALSGMLDVDSAIITMGNLPPGSLAPRIAGLVLMPPILLNTLIKAGVALSFAGWRKAWPSATALGLSALASGIAMLFALV